MSSNAASGSSFPRRVPTDYVSPFMDELVAPYHPPPSPEPIEDAEDGPTTCLGTFADMSREADDEEFIDAPMLEGPSLYTRPIYQSAGDWALLNGVIIGDSTSTISKAVISEGRTYKVTLATGTAGGQKIHYLSKFCKTFKPGSWDGFLIEIALFKLNRLPAQVAPTVIGVYCDAGRMSMAMAPPHHSFWMHASPEMPHSLKERCLDAVDVLHTHGILHGDLRLCNILIGGDAKVTIINYHHSRLAFPITQPNIRLKLATPADFDLELRRFKWALDYRGARTRAEARLHELIKGGDPGNLSHVQEVRFLCTLKPDKVDPRRFVMPNQTPEDLAKAIGHFMDRMEEFKAQERQLISATIGPLPTPVVAAAPVGRASIAAPASPVSGRCNLRSPSTDPGGADICTEVSCTPTKRKRNSTAAASGSRPAKKVCFSGSFSTDSEDGDPGPSLIGPNPSPPQSPGEVGDVDITRDSKRKITEANIQRCIELGLPHPDAVRRDPSNPCWQDPDIMEYIDRHNRDALYKMYLMKREPEKAVKMPQPRRSLGGLKRALRAIAYHRRMIPITPANHGDTSRQGQKRKRVAADDSEGFAESLDTPRRRKAIKASHHALPGSTRRPVRGILKNPSSVMPRIIARSGQPSQRLRRSPLAMMYESPLQSSSTSCDSDAAEQPSSPRMFESGSASPTFTEIVPRRLRNGTLASGKQNGLYKEVTSGFQL
ncbi:hypothetical protein LshimejAT787_0306250 [Lyophyllum shimeji]|uniref:Uncharacterized protein n=1 Tax=Lyophyllum shimeji TaxID=47721 RepID=A0A9P3PHR0_LYOSH|nr:hypothetical protein LshimejAT787_0306250 [Lyophyllum shimeji]